ncbi:MAG: 4-hydroxythreonine-4-phosphate dehydrogenase PdxA [Rikenellaceae bacterium]|jgi:4-hydroxythreonine-4-phosphate dehydrogenase|nr:4-hydroxythreonine-4-phosphate dehydrogenase PdxA [Rikenellaceae bacterium]
MSEYKIKAGITHGDINGIGYETIIKTFLDPRMVELFTPVIYGSAKVAGVYKKYIPESDALSFNLIRTASEANAKRVNLITCIDDNVKVDVGQATLFGGQCAAAALSAATKDLREGAIDVLVTSPINKATVQGRDFSFTGHTEYLAAQFEESEPLMMMVSDTMRVGLVTIHLPLAEVAGQITTEMILRKLRALKRSLVRDFGIVEPRIAVLALNPHAGDEGLLGKEEIDIIRPALVSAADERILAFGPFAADGFFGSGGYTKYDAVLAMYHDQGLAPFKALSGETGVNFTAGLSIVRTSPAHGVAYNIAGQGIANESSLRAALYLATDIWRNRRIYEKITANPLKKAVFDRNGKDESIKDLPEPAGE